MHHNYITKSRQVNDILFQIRSCSVEDRTTYETRVVVVIHRALAVCKKYSKRSVDGANKLIVIMRVSDCWLSSCAIYGRFCVLPWTNNKNTICCGRSLRELKVHSFSGLRCTLTWLDVTDMIRQASKQELVYTSYTHRAALVCFR